ncbi:hypothetical protein CYY_005820 [Polysphondylium violaceum]|uniref:Chromatin assembly factor 1 subunit A n=1 Tax=Polysphondylium violaceum TaxID=133409 RepID=A0A8J4V3S7_9MYCE|nr:hypothetical protein CYY_005820 [Polysphondylium violaceum]
MDTTTTTMVTTSNIPTTFTADDTSSSSNDTIATTNTTPSTSQDNNSSNNNNQGAATPKKRKRLTEEEKKQREVEKRLKDEKKEEERLKREEDKKKKEEEKKRREEEAEKKKEERELEKKKKEEEKKKREEEKKKRDDEAEKKKRGKRIREKEKGRGKKRKEEEAEIEKKKKEEELEKKQPKLTKFFTAIEPVRTKSISNSFIQPLELPPNTIIFNYPKVDCDLERFENLVFNQSENSSTSSTLTKQELFKELFISGGGKSKQNDSNYRWPPIKKRTKRFIIESLPGSIIHHGVLSNLGSLKFMKFHDSYRPSYYGTFSKKSKIVNAKNPFKKDTTIDYDYDSADEWEDEPDGDVDNVSSADEKNDSSDEEDDDELDEWVVQDEDVIDQNINNNTNSNVTSTNDNMAIDVDNISNNNNSNNINNNTQTQEKRKKKKKIITKKVPIIIAPNEILSKEFESIVNIFTIQSISNDFSFPIKLSEPIKIVKESSISEFPQNALPTLLHIIKENKLSYKKLVEIIQQSFPNISSKQIKEKLNEHCTFTNKSWTIKAESESFLSTPIHSDYPLPIIIPKSPANNRKKVNNLSESSESSTSNKKINNNNSDESGNDDDQQQQPKEICSSPKPKATKSKKKPPQPTQSNSLFNYFSKVDKQEKEWL